MLNVTITILYIPIMDQRYGLSFSNPGLSVEKRNKNNKIFARFNINISLQYFEINIFIDINKLKNYSIDSSEVEAFWEQEEI